MQEAGRAVYTRWAERQDLSSFPTDPQEFLDHIVGLMQACEACALSQHRATVVRPDGKVGARVMILGEGPGFLEDLAQIPFVGPAELRHSRCAGCFNARDCYETRLLGRPNAFGRKAKFVQCRPEFNDRYNLPASFYLRSAGAVLDAVILRQFGYSMPRQSWIDGWLAKNPERGPLPPSPWFVTNVVACRSFDPVKLRDVEPGAVFMAKCRPWLLMQWAAVQPRVVVCLGRKALQAAMGSESAAELVPPGSLVQTKMGPVLYQIHPAHFMRESNAETKAYGYAKVGETLRRAAVLAGLVEDRAD